MGCSLILRFFSLLSPPILIFRRKSPLLHFSSPLIDPSISEKKSVVDKRGRESNVQKFLGSFVSFHPHRLVLDAVINLYRRFRCCWKARNQFRRDFMCLLVLATSSFCNAVRYALICYGAKLLLVESIKKLFATQNHAANWQLRVPLRRSERAATRESSKFPRIFKLSYITRQAERRKFLPLIPLIIRLFTHIINNHDIFLASVGPPSLMLFAVEMSLLITALIRLAFRWQFLL